MAAGAISIGANADSGTFRGQFEDLEVRTYYKESRKEEEVWKQVKRRREK